MSSHIELSFHVVLKDESALEWLEEFYELAEASELPLENVSIVSNNSRVTFKMLPEHLTADLSDVVSHTCYLFKVEASDPEISSVEKR